MHKKNFTKTTNPLMEVVPVGQDKKLFDEFMALPYRLYANDAAWVAPLKTEYRFMFDRKKNPFFQHAEAELFLCFLKDAWGRGKVVGRISAQIDHGHLKIHKDGAGFFGCFEAIDDMGVARALFTAAEQWLVARDMKTMRGPYTLNINGEAGLQIDGFQHVPMFLTAYNLPYYRHLVEGSGFAKIKELYSWRYSREFIVPPRAKKISQHALQNKAVKVRTIDMKHFEYELGIGLKIFNDAWKNNWGFMPLIDAEIQKIGRDMKMIMDPRIVVVVEYRGKVAGMAITVPNINEALKPLKGKLFPFGWLKLLWNTKVRRPRKCRLMLLGILPELQRLRIGGELGVLLSVEVYRRAKAAGYQEAELSWTLDDNHAINHVIRMMGSHLYKTHYIYECPIGNRYAASSIL